MGRAWGDCVPAEADGLGVPVAGVGPGLVLAPVGDGPLPGEVTAPEEEFCCSPPEACDAPSPDPAVGVVVGVVDTCWRVDELPPPNVVPEPDVFRTTSAIGLPATSSAAVTVPMATAKTSTEDRASTFQLRGRNRRRPW
ncbi:hypothetical protein ACFQZC_11710 [Streptacidiphilus monticola]